MAFGHGIHYCLAAHHAQIETIEVLRAMRDQRVEIQPAGAPQRTGSAILRAYTSLPVRSIR